MSGADRPIRAVVFDLDGTLIDSAPDIGHALNSALRSEGLGVFDLQHVREWIGDGPDVLIERALAALGQPGDAALRARLRGSFDASTLNAPLAHGKVFEGIEALLDRLHPLWPMAVVTNKPTALARAVVAAAGLLHRFAGVYGADTAALRKPAPGLLQQAAGELGLDTAQLLMVGDSAADLGAARAAGCPSAWVEWGYAGSAALAVEPRWRAAHPEQLWSIVQSAARGGAG